MLLCENIIAMYHYLSKGDNVEKVEVPIYKAHRLIYPLLVVLVSCINPETKKPNIIAIDWVTPVSLNPPMVGILLAPRRYSHEQISRAREFVVNVPTMEILEKVIKCGKVSGRHHDKFVEFGLTPKPSKVIKTPIVEECVAHIECKLVKKIPAGDRTIFLGEVVAAYANKGALSEDLIDAEKTKKIYQSGGDIFTTLSDKRVMGYKYSRLRKNLINIPRHVREECLK